MKADIEAHLDRLFGYAYGLCGDRHDAQDLVQQCALKALTASNAPDREPDFKYWLFRVLRNAFIDLQRSRSRRSFEPYHDNQLQHGRDPADFERRLIDNLSVWQALPKLSVDHREVIVSVDIAGFSYAEASVLLDVPSGTIMSRLSRARKLLLEAISTDSLKKVQPNILPFRASKETK